MEGQTPTFRAHALPLCLTTSLRVCSDGSSVTDGKMDPGKVNRKWWKVLKLERRFFFCLPDPSFSGTSCCSYFIYKGGFAKDRDLAANASCVSQGPVRFLKDRVPRESISPLFGSGGKGGTVFTEKLEVKDTTVTETSFVEGGMGVGHTGLESWPGAWKSGKGVLWWE